MIKTVKSPDYNSLFNDETGFFARWGKTKEEDPDFCPFGSEILDIEISTICTNGCSFCYKSNTGKGKNMSFETFKKMADKFPKTVGQIAFGIGDIDANPDLKKIFEYCREIDIVPNVTINGSRMTPEWYDFLADTCGAVAVSLYDFDQCYNAVQELSSRGMKQVNIHCLLAEETYVRCLDVLYDSRNDERLEGLNAVVFLWMKPIGKRNKYHQLNSKQQYVHLINYAIDRNIRFGFDSCTAPIFLDAVKDHPNYTNFEMMAEPCESTLFSYYINVEGTGHPCSFAEDASEGVDVVGCIDFLKDVWYNRETVKFRNNSIKSADSDGCRSCTLYKLVLN